MAKCTGYGYVASKKNTGNNTGIKQTASKKNQVTLDFRCSEVSCPRVMVPNFTNGLAKLNAMFQSSQSVNGPDISPALVQRVRVTEPCLHAY
jgi:hypothetical protein